jgi:hypothetical protein
MNKKQLVHSAFFIVFSLSAMGQKKRQKDVSNLPTIELGYFKQGRTRAELGVELKRTIGYHNRPDTGDSHYHHFVAWGPHFSVLGLFDKAGILRVGQKAGIGFDFFPRNSYLGYSLKLNIENYTHKDQRWGVETGIIILGLFDVRYGYSQPMGTEWYQNFSKHRLGVLISLHVGFIELLFQNNYER